MYTRGTIIINHIHFQRNDDEKSRNLFIGLLTINRVSHAYSDKRS